MVCRVEDYKLSFKSVIFYNNAQANKKRDLMKKKIARKGENVSYNLYNLLSCNFTLFTLFSIIVTNFKKYSDKIISHISPSTKKNKHTLRTFMQNKFKKFTGTGKVISGYEKISKYILSSANRKFTRSCSFAHLFSSLSHRKCRCIVLKNIFCLHQKTPLHFLKMKKKRNSYACVTDLGLPRETDAVTFSISRKSISRIPRDKGKKNRKAIVVKVFHFCGE